MNATLPATTDTPLTPATAVEIVGALKLLWTGFETKISERATEREREDAQRDMVQVYVAALHGHPLWAIEKAVLMFIRGEVKAASRKFAPRPPEIGEVCIELVEVVRSNMRLEQRKRDERRQEVKAIETMTPEHRQRMKLKMMVLNRLGADVAAECLRKGGLQPYIDVALAAELEIPEGLVSAAEIDGDRAADEANL